MSKRILCGAVIVGLLCLAGCDKRPSDSPAPRADAGKAEAQKPFSSPPDPSLPAATSVVTPAATATAKDESGNHPKGDLTRAEESSAMPKAGQTNNHSSTALDPAKRAGAP